MANFYEAAEVRRSVPVRRYLIDNGVRICGDRCVASWRGGDDLTCTIYDTKGENVVYDHKDGRRLNVIDICMEVEGLPFRLALAALGDRYGVTAADGTERPPTKPKPMVAPNWVRVAWLILNAGDDALMADAYGHLNAGGDYLTDADLAWARRVAGFVQRGLSLDDAIRVAGEMCRQLTAREVAA